MAKMGSGSVLFVLTEFGFFTSLLTMRGVRAVLARC